MSERERERLRTAGKRRIQLCHLQPILPWFIPHQWFVNFCTSQSPWLIFTTSPPRHQLKEGLQWDLPPQLCIIWQPGWPTSWSEHLFRWKNPAKQQNPRAAHYMDLRSSHVSHVNSTCFCRGIVSFLHFKSTKSFFSSFFRHPLPQSLQK